MSRLCIGTDCYRFRDESSDTLVLYLCSDCKSKYVFVGEHELRCMVAEASIELKSSIDFKVYKHIELRRYPELTSYITNMVKHPNRTIIRQAVFGGYRT